MKYTHEQQEKALGIAFKKCGLNNHTVIFEFKKDLVTAADKLIWIWYRKKMPVRKSYMYCNALDMTFFFTKDGKAMYTYAGQADERDSGELLIKAFAKAEEVRIEMERAIKEVRIQEQCQSLLD